MQLTHILIINSYYFSKNTFPHHIFVKIYKNPIFIIIFLMLSKNRLTKKSLLHIAVQKTLFDLIKLHDFISFYGVQRLMPLHLQIMRLNQDQLLPLCHHQFVVSPLHQLNLVHHSQKHCHLHMCLHC